MQVLHIVRRKDTWSSEDPSHALTSSEIQVKLPQTCARLLHQLSRKKERNNFHTVGNATATVTVSINLPCEESPDNADHRCRCWKSVETEEREREITEFERCHSYEGLNNPRFMYLDIFARPILSISRHSS